MIGVSSVLLSVISVSPYVLFDNYNIAHLFYKCNIYEGNNLPCKNNIMSIGITQVHLQFIYSSKGVDANGKTCNVEENISYQKN